MARLPRVDALLVGILRPAMPAGVTVGTRIPNTMVLPFVMARRSGGSSIDPRFVDQAIVDVQTWADTDTQSEHLAQLAREALFRASRSPQTIVDGVGYIAWFAEESAPVELPTEAEDHQTYRYQATYSLNTRPDQG